MVLSDEKSIVHFYLQNFPQVVFNFMDDKKIINHNYLAKDF